MARALVFVVSDSLGDTAAAMTAAAVSQFNQGDVDTVRLSKLKDITALEEAVSSRVGEDEEVLLFHTIVDPALKLQLKDLAADKGYKDVDLIGEAIESLSAALGKESQGIPGTLHEVDTEYFRRIEAMEFTVNHDDGRRSEELNKADIVLLGVSRSSKTPLSLILAQRGYKVANLPLALGMKEPPEIFDLDKRRVFGLMTSVEVLTEIRMQRLGKAAGIASSYADPAMVQKDLDEARALMRRLGIIVLHTNNRAIEEVASEIESYLQRYGLSV